MIDTFMQSLNTPSSEPSDNLFELVADEDRKKYVCKHAGCGKFFRYKSEIVRHAATHSESRPFVCNYDNCFKAFKRNDALENHIRSSHTKETPFVCPFTECGMKFTTHGSFRYHVLKHNKQLPAGLENTLNLHEAPQDLPMPRKQLKLDPFAQESPAPQSKEFGKVELFQEKLKGKCESDEFFCPAPRFAGKIQWEMVDDEKESSTPVQIPKVETVPKEKYDSVVEENQVLKRKLTTKDNVIKTMQKQIGDLLNNLFMCQSQLANNSKSPQTTTASPPQQSEPSVQESFVESNEKIEDQVFDMINYNDEGNGFRNHSSRLSMIEPLPLLENHSIDGYLNFGELESFGF